MECATEVGGIIEYMNLVASKFEVAFFSGLPFQINARHN